MDYAPPEALESPYYATYSNAFDVWCLGATLYSMRMGHPPFRNGREEINSSNLRERIIKGDLITNSPRWKSSSRAFKSLIYACLEKDYKKRIPLSELQIHRWINNFSTPVIKAEIDDSETMSNTNAMNNFDDQHSLQESAVGSSTQPEVNSTIHETTSSFKERTVSETSISNDSTIASTELKYTRQRKTAQLSLISLDSGASLRAIAGSSTDTKTFSTLSQRTDTCDTSSILATAGSSSGVRTISDRSDEATVIEKIHITPEKCKKVIINKQNKIEKSTDNMSTISEADTSNSGNIEKRKCNSNSPQNYDTSSVLGIAGSSNGDAISELGDTEDYGSDDSDLKFNIKHLLNRCRMISTSKYDSNTDLIGFDENNFKPVIEFSLSNVLQKSDIKDTSLNSFNNDCIVHSFGNKLTQQGIVELEVSSPVITTTTTSTKVSFRTDRKNKQRNNTKIKSPQSNENAVSDTQLLPNSFAVDSPTKADLNDFCGFLTKEKCLNQRRTTHMQNGLEHLQRIFNLPLFSNIQYNATISSTSAPLTLLPKDNFDKDINDILMLTKARLKSKSNENDLTNVRKHLKRSCTQQPTSYKEIHAIEPGTNANSYKYRLSNQSNKSHSSNNLNQKQITKKQITERKTRKRHNIQQISKYEEEEGRKGRKIPRYSMDRNFPKSQSNLTKNNKSKKATTIHLMLSSIEANGSGSAISKTNIKNPLRASVATCSNNASSMETVFAAPKLKCAVRTSVASAINNKSTTTALKDLSAHQKSNKRMSSHRNSKSFRLNSYNKEIQPVVETNEI